MTRDNVDFRIKLGELEKDDKVLMDEKILSLKNFGIILFVSFSILRFLKEYHWEKLDLRLHFYCL